MSVTRDLFGGEISSNGAEAFNSGPQGRFNEGEAHRRPPAAGRHLHRDARDRRQARRPRRCRHCAPSTAACSTTTSPTARAASTAGTRPSRKPASTSACASPVQGLQSPHRRVRRQPSARRPAAHRSRMAAANGARLPNDADMNFIDSLMKPCMEPDVMPAGSHRRRGHQPAAGDFEYVRIDRSPLNRGSGHERRPSRVCHVCH